MSALRVGLCCASDEQELRAAVLAAGGEIAWITDSETALADAARKSPSELVLVRHGGPIDAARATRAIDRAVPVVIAIDDAARAVDLFDILTRGRVEVAALTRAVGAGLVDVGAVLKHHGRARSIGPSSPDPSVLGSASAPQHAPVLALAASAGGPEALATVLRDLGASSLARVLVAQHIDPPFVSGLAEWLARASSRPVSVAADGAMLTTDAALVVRSERQPTVTSSGTIRYVTAPAGQAFHPSIDLLWESLARTSARGVAVLLTGMGQDGARGLLALREAGWTTIAQDAESSRIYGMPREAARLGAAEIVAPLERIGAASALALGRRGMRPSVQ